MQEGSGVTNLQTELNYLDSFKSYCNSSVLCFLSSGGVGPGGWGGPGWSAIVYMSLGMFRGKESSNRIELSRLVQDLLNFGVLGSLRLWGWGVGGWGWLGVPPTYVHMHTHARMCTHAHACVVSMIISCKWPPPLGESLEIPYDVICVCMCVCMCVGCTLSPPRHPHPPTFPPPGGDPRNQSKFNCTSTNWDIWIPFEDLKSVETSPPMGGCMVLWVGGWVDGWGQVKTLKIWKLLIESR